MSDFNCDTINSVSKGLKKYLLDTKVKDENSLGERMGQEAMLCKFQMEMMNGRKSAGKQ